MLITGGNGHRLYGVLPLLCLYKFEGILIGKVYFKPTFFLKEKHKAIGGEFKI